MPLMGIKNKPTNETFVVTAHERPKLRFPNSQRPLGKANFAIVKTCIGMSITACEVFRAQN